MNTKADKNPNTIIWYYSAGIYLSALVLIEIIAISTSALIGSVLYFFMVLVQMLQAVRYWGQPGEQLYIGLMLAPLMRLFGFVLFLNYGKVITQTFFIGIPIFVAVYLVKKVTNLTWAEVGFNFVSWMRLLLIGLSGVLIGGLQYLFTQQPVHPLSNWLEISFAIIVLLGAGFLEELVFRGLLLRIAITNIGVWPGITFVAIILSIFQIGLLSPVFLVFVFLVGLVMGWLVYRTGSIFGVALAHGLANLTFYLVVPVFLG